MTRYIKVTTVQLLAFEGEDFDEDFVNLFHDSMMDTLLDGQDAITETSDAKFEYQPGPIITLETVEVDETGEVKK